MSEKQQGKILEHDYDGIREFDNPLPGWWLATFYGAVVFAFLYVGYYHFGPGPSPEAQLAQGLEEIHSLDRSRESKEPVMTEEALMAIYKDPAQREAGKALFLEKCSACHASDGGGIIGPNLTDRFWLHGRGTLSDIVKVVSEGVPEKGMPTWEIMLKREQIYAIAAHVKSLQGTHPAHPKPPQGEEIKE